MLSVEAHGNLHSRKALIVEDIREAEIELKEKGYECDRITHNELLSSSGAEYTGKLLKGDYSLLWISTPNDWYVRAKKTTSHWQRLHHWIQKAMLLGILLILFGPPGFFWKVPNVKETIQESKMTVLRMRLCHFGDQYDKSSKSKPSGSYLQLATTAKLSHKKWQCNCTIPIQDHTLDWYGRHPEQAEWRRKISVKFVKEVCNTIPGIVEAHGNLHSNTKVHAIQDGMTSPLPTNSDTEQNLPNPETNLPNPSISLPTDARLRQKERLTKLKEAGLKPKKKKTYT